MQELPTKNQQWIFKKRPTGLPSKDSWELKEVPIPSLQPGQILIKHLYISVDPYLRIMMSDVHPTPLKEGDLQHSGVVGEVIAKNQNNEFEIGDKVFRYDGWERYSISDGKDCRKINEKIAPISTALGILGMPGMTAYFGTLEVAKIKEGETFVVSGAAGAVGSLAGQIAKIKGCRVVGIAGSDEKIRYITKELGFDVGINYKTHNSIESMQEELKKACPKGIDAYFDNVGGMITDSIIPLLNNFGRVAICGQISQYNKMDKPEMGPRFLHHLIYKRITIQGFLVSDFASKQNEFLDQMQQWLNEGKIKFKETVKEGFEKLPEIFVGLFTGENVGKMVCKV